ncbi:MAG: type II secretion system protein [Pseudomonadota bacterium]
MRQQSGFTLVELVVTIVLSTIVVSFMAMFITGPVTAYSDQARRAELVELADSALRGLTREVRRALPNSIRVRSNGAIVALELLNTVDGVRYRARPPGSEAQQLRFSDSDDSFNSVGSFSNIARPFTSTTHYLSVYNVGVTGADAYELSNVITPAGTQISIAADGSSGEDRVTMSPAFRFAYESPRQRVFLVEGPVSYLCNTITGELKRYSGYAISATHSARDSEAELLAAGAVESTVVYNASGCGFSYAPGNSERAGLLSASLTVSEAGENVSLLRQAHVDNVP